MTKNPIEKKEYSKPIMRVVKLKQRSSLLCASGDCADDVILGNNSSIEGHYRA